MTASLTVTYLGGPTALLELAGLRLLTDPTFDPPGEYPMGSRKLVKTGSPGLDPDEVGLVDAVLLSHDQHPDNLDHGGREWLARQPLALSTSAARERLGDPVRGLAPWESAELSRPDGGTLTVTAVPAQHGPDGSEPVTGPVLGFVLSGDGLPTVYVSGDNASLDVVRSIAGRFPGIDSAVLFAGGAQTVLFPGEDLTLSSENAALAAEILGVRKVVPVHFEQWAHFTNGRDTLTPAFEKRGLGERLHLLQPGGRTTV
ncbi:MBL fold metallo-hydrolase [Streptomyces sp. TRM66268-LWL]|uniref:MBL fold metallo-hydrolase n=1 Tax=Streptomyces polyasparticus TaxID=2767826 RepID=A0ABR7SW26_9ACTN|nr:MBL fold metallo-hydrolase [Streptomyces polyasparticus]MBC9718463.1 MBL fold metallo-hydrolase [Streptomyces polyasparticus]